MAKRDRARSRRSDAEFSEEVIVRAAVEILDEAGVTGFTMRALARRLETYPATLYWHVGNRNAVLARVYQLVLEEMQIPAAQGGWESWLAVVAREYRRVMHRHPNAASLVLYPIVTSADLVEAILACLEDAGFRSEALAGAFNMFVGSVTGWVAIELSPANGESDEKWSDDLETQVRAAANDDHPTIARQADHIIGEVISLRWQGGAEQPMDRSFEFALAGWLSGLKMFLDNQP